ncbi:cation-translocating P-type ATPase [Bdellovibrionota bacterium FG-2]
MSSGAVLRKRHLEEDRRVSLAHSRESKTLHLVPWAEDVEKVLQSLDTKQDEGLPREAAAERLVLHGKNVLREKEKVSVWIKFLGQFKSPVVVTLLVATLVSALVGELVDAIAIISIVIINAVVGYLQESKAEAAVAALQKLASPKARVLRSKQVAETLAENIVEGDILIFESGDYVAADARIIQASQLSVDESLLTGESLPVKKGLAAVVASAPLAERSNMLFASTAVSTGSGRALVTATGMDSEIGHIAGMLESADATETPLQSRLKEVGSKLLLLCLGVVALVGALGLIHGEAWLSVLMTAISLAVAAIPEGLPAIVTLALALAIHRMTKRNAIVRHLPAVETLGSTDVICTDKTGTLTTGKMRVRELVGPDVIIVENKQDTDPKVFNRLVESSVLCSNASLGKNGEMTGDPTEVALLFMAKDQKQDPIHLQKDVKRVYEWSFDSVRKRMSVAVAGDSQIIIHVKGAPESMLPLCQLDDTGKRKITEALQTLSEKGRRMLAVARRTLPIRPEAFSAENYREPASVENDLEFLGLVAIADPPRDESIEAIRRCKSAGIRVVMITGDHPATAKAIGQELGILELGKFEGVMTGAELDAMDAKTLAERIETTAVYARVAPEHKLKIIEAWKSKGSVVAMTGDGVNDAPALKAASIGISMGKGGTEVARQASSMILADDNFATIVGAVEEGRAIYGNIRRTIQYLLSGNLAEILIMLGAAVMGWPAPLAPIHLLWINLVTDGLPSLALAAEPVPKDILESGKPSPKKFFDRRFYKEMTFIGVTIAVLSLVVYGYSFKREGALTARTHVFSFLVFAELFRSFASRSETKTFFQLGAFSNTWHLFAVSIPIGFQFLLHHTVWFTSLFKVHMIEWNECLVLVGLTLIPTAVLEIRKLMRSKRSPN